MKNYFVQTLCKVKKEDYDPNQQVPIHEPDTYPMYQELQNLSYSTFKHFMEGDWEYVLLEEEVTHVFEVFQQNFRKIYDLWNKEPCNILFTGLDTTMIQPTEVFGKYDKFTMFNHSDPKNTPKFENNFNCDVRYYPATMDKKWMDYTMEKIDSLKVWSDEQDIYNDMLWGQEVKYTDVIDPKMAYQGHMIPNLETNIDRGNHWNGIDINDAHIIHWHSSRGIANRVELFRNICEWLEVPVANE